MSKKVVTGRIFRNGVIVGIICTIIIEAIMLNFYQIQQLSRSLINQARNVQALVQAVQDLQQRQAVPPSVEDPKKRRR